MRRSPVTSEVARPQRTLSHGGDDRGRLVCAKFAIDGFSGSEPVGGWGGRGGAGEEVALAAVAAGGAGGVELGGGFDAFGGDVHAEGVGHGGDGGDDDAVVGAEF